MAKKTVRTGLIGAGFSAAFHYEALQKVAGVDVDVVGVYARTPQRAAAFAQKCGIRYFDRLEALLEAVDVVHICTPPYAHTALAIAALEQNKHVICEKPLTGYFGDGSADFHWDRADMELARSEAMEKVQQLLEAEARSQARLFYAENWIYAPSIQKEREILEKTGGQILWMHGEEAHSGSHSVDYAYAARCGGGVLIGKGCHPLTAALYLKR
ncbi:MAG TPA: Gfo/Idh/MocA family oxidoreductase, partial [Thermoguttaceae bacterium]|nr:Gfo/Idh/MocA family oxidoreductase [Thermoguttaceae bacterium]